MATFLESQHVDFVSLVPHGLFAHISMVVYPRVEASSPSRQLFIFSCSALFVSVTLSALQKCFRPATKIHRCIFNLCVASSLQPLTEAQRALTCCEEEKTLCLSQLYKDNADCTPAPVFHTTPCCVEHFFQHTSATRCKNSTFFPCLQFTSWKQKEEEKKNKGGMSLLFGNCSSLFSLFMFDVWKRQMGGRCRWMTNRCSKL